MVDEGEWVRGNRTGYRVRKVDRMVEEREWEGFKRVKEWWEREKWFLERPGEGGSHSAITVLRGIRL